MATIRGVCGIDAGQDGALCISTRDGLVAEPMPSVDGVLDLAWIVRWLVAHRESIDRAFLEKPGVRPFQHASAGFSQGRSFGQIEGILAGLGVPYELVTPQVWMREMHSGVELAVKRTVKDGKATEKRDTKKMSRLAFSRLFPTYDFRATEKSRIPHEGMIESALIATYGHRKLVNP